MIRISAGQVVLPDRVVVDAEVVVALDGTIAGIERAEREPEFHTLVPGFVDLQVNGHDDVDVARAEGDDWARLDALLLAQGVTAWCPTLITAPLDAYRSVLYRIAERAGDPALGVVPEILGVHLEGPFLGDRPGAHPRDLIRPVDLDWLEALPMVVRLVTIAPEADPGHEALAWAARRKVIASIGHSGASADDTRAAFGAGARMVTHLFNAMSGLDHRAPGVAAAALLDSDVVAGLIADGVHVDPDLVRLAFAMKGPERIALVTDAVGWRRGGPGTVEVAFDGVAPRLADGTLAGSALTMDRAVANVVTWGATDLVGAVRAASTTPADLVGRRDLGRIAPRAQADLVALGEDGSCAATWIAGARVH